MRFGGFLFFFFPSFIFLFFIFPKGTTGFGTNPGGLFGQQNQQNTSLFSKPFAQAITTQTTGFSFGNTSTLGQPSTNTMVRKQVFFVELSNEALNYVQLESSSLLQFLRVDGYM